MASFTSQCSRTLFLVIVLFAALVQGDEGQSTHKRHSLMIVGVDGLRPDVLLRANTPNIRAELQKGSYSFFMRTTDLAITLPSFTSMVTGVPPSVHGITWNDDRHAHAEAYPKVPTLFDLAKNSGLKTALIAGKSKFSLLTKPTGLSQISIPVSDTLSDADVADSAKKILTSGTYELVFAHFPDVDSVGHAIGWGSREQIQAVERVDAFIGEVFAAFRSGGGEFIIISSDHGGSGKSHGTEIIGSQFVPFIISGPGIKQNYDLSLSNQRLFIEDIFASAVRVLEIQGVGEVAGRAPEAAFQKN